MSASIESDVHITPAEARRFYEARAKSTIEDLREQKQLSYKALARRSESTGVEVSDRVLINRVNRGNYSFAFALQLLAVMGLDILEVPKLPEERARVS